MAPSPSKKRPSSPTKKHRSLAAARAPLAVTPAKAQFKRSSKPLTPAAIAAGQKNKRRQDSQQVALPFETADRIKVGLKILLDETIYDHPNDVS